jgi:glutamate dehydrogenase (NAD(P)+)
MWEINPYEVAKTQLEIIAKKLNLSSNLLNFLKNIEQSLIVSIPIIMDDGTLKIFEGYRVHHSSALGPCKGGVRYSEMVTLDEIKALAMLMTWKTSLHRLPLGGSKGGVCVYPKNLSKRELEWVTRRYTAEIINIIGPDRDIPAPDVGTDAQIMAYMMDTYSMQYGRTIPGVVTGKPIEIGGSPGRTGAAGNGLFFIIERYCEKYNLNLKSMNVVIQGFGKVGSVIAEILWRYGCKILAITELAGGIYCKNGLNIDELIEWRDKGNLLKDFKGDSINSINNEDLFKIKCDLLIPAATENQITEHNAKDLDCKIILEGANGPTTPKADDILNEKGVIIIPDILANGGGVIVSYFEYVQDISSYYWDLERVNKELKKIILNTFENVCEISKEKKVSLRTAAYMIAVSRVAKAIELRGIFP